LAEVVATNSTRFEAKEFQPIIDPVQELRNFEFLNCCAAKASDTRFLAEITPFAPAILRAL
jgi:hypothetical protein